MAKYTSPVTKENYLELWRCVWRKYGQAKHSMVTGKLIGIFGELTFLACMLFVTIGMFYSIQIPVICDFLDKIPYLIPMWQKFSGWLFQPQMIPPVRIVIAIGVCFGAGMAVSAALAIAVLVLYHPIPRKPSGDPIKDAATMSEKIHKARIYRNRAKNNIALFCDIMYLVLLAALLTAVILLNLDKTDVIGQISKVFPINNMVVLIFTIFATFFCYSALDTWFFAIVKLFFYCNIPVRIMADADRFKLQVADLDTLPEEELSEKWAKEAVEKRIKGLDMEKGGEFARAKQLLLEAALAGDAPAMDHYARHCIIQRQNEEAIFWLQSCVDTGKADDVTKKRLKDMKRGRTLTLKYY